MLQQRQASCPGRPVNRLLVVFLLAATLCPAYTASSSTHPASRYDSVPKDISRTEAAETISNPLPYSTEVIAEGKKHYLRHCQTCHGFDGRALENIDYEAADLTRPEVWLYGTSDGELFLTTRDGAGKDMPPFDNLDEQEIWQLLHYLRSIGPEELQPEAAP